MARALESAARGDQVFIDSTIFIYHFVGASAQCRRFLARCESLEIEGVTSTGILAEVTHRLMMIEAVAAGLVSPGNVARKLAERPEIVKKLGSYRRDVESISLMGIRIVGVGLSDLLKAHELQVRHGLLTNDSLVAAAALEIGSPLATSDAAFGRVKGLTVLSPDDLRPAAKP